MTTTDKIKASPTYKQELKEARQKSAKPLLWIAIISMVMFWAGLTSAYIIRADNGNWLIFNIPDIFFVSTAIIVTSSITYLTAYLAIKKDNFQLSTIMVGITLLLAVAFAWCQYDGWMALFQKGIVLGGKHSNPSGSFFILFVFAHLAHFLGGFFSLIVVFIKSLRRRYSSQNYLGMEISGIYWHFLDILWVYLFLFLYFNR